VGKCWPGRAPGASADRAPSRAEVARWAPFVLEEVRLVGPRLVVLVGRLAHQLAFPGRPVAELIGAEMQWAGADTVCLPHPSGASTWLNSPAHQELWRSAIQVLADRWRRLLR
jgi:uracil-DNA glycosylase